MCVFVAFAVFALSSEDKQESEFLLQRHSADTFPLFLLSPFGLLLLPCAQTLLAGGEVLEWATN